MSYIRDSEFGKQNAMKIQHKMRKLIIGSMILLLVIMVGCSYEAVSKEQTVNTVVADDNADVMLSPVPARETEKEITSQSTITSTPILLPTPTPTPLPTPTPTPTPISVHDQILSLEQQENVEEEILPVKAALLVNMTEKDVIYSYKATEQLYPASITKLMTALVAFDYYETLDDTVTISNIAVIPVIPSAKMCGFHSGDKISLYELIQCMLIYSGNDSAVAVAEHISGTEKEFVVLMNQFAADMGLESSYFCNSHGLPDDNHVTSAYDIYRIMEKLFQYEDFPGIIGLSSIEVDVIRNNEVKTLAFESTNQFLNGKYSIPEGLTLLGGKTGTTNKAGCCLVVYVTDKNGNCYIAEIFGAESYDILYLSMIQLLEYISE